MRLLPLVVLSIAHSALADPRTQLLGRITETATHKPIQGAVVTIAHGKTELETSTDANGLYRFVVPDDGGAYTVTYRYADVSGRGSVDVVGGRVAQHDGSLDVDSDTIIFIREPKPVVAPKMVKDPERHRTPEYSDAAILKDAWTRAWLLLDIDPQGTVTRVKMLNAPGYDLEPIAIKQAFDTKFHPGRDGHGNAVRSLLVWTIEWPSYWWMIDRDDIPTRMPFFVEYVPCRGSGPLPMGSIYTTSYRDCTPPNLSRITTAKWITP